MRLRLMIIHANDDQSIKSENQLNASQVTSDLFNMWLLNYDMKEDEQMLMCSPN